MTEQWLQRIDAALRGSGMDAAGALALQALDEGIEHPTLLNLAAARRFNESRTEDAVRLLQRARELAPTDANVANSLGVCLTALGQTDAALDAYEAAARLNPRLAPAHFNRGTILEGRGEINAARLAYERAASLDPNYVEPLACLALLDAQAGDAVGARARGEQAIAKSSGNILGRMAVASAGLQQRDFPAAAAQLLKLQAEPQLTPINRSFVNGLIGDYLDASGQPAEAFAAYEAANAELRTLNAVVFEAPGRETALQQARRLAASFQAADRQLWRHAPPLRPGADEPRTHVFLVGFPRSGTTLLESVLAAHPDVVSLEEKDCLERVAAPYLESDGGLAALAELAPGEAGAQRDAYWNSVRGYGIHPKGKVFIDKMPLASVQLPVVARLFPGARILFCLRDPRDVVLSCFRRRFVLNPAMYELLTLRGAAEFYDAVMRLSDVYREILPLRQHLFRYESLVDDFEGTARDACTFLDVKWDNGMADFAAKARTRGITTPSASQVARGLNREGQGTWRRYQKQMAPVLPLLQPWVERFGYSAD